MPKLWIGDEQKRSEKFQETGSATDVIISDLISAISYAEDTQFIADGFRGINSCGMSTVFEKNPKLSHFNFHTKTIFY